MKPSSKKPARLDRQTVGNVGMSDVCYRLSLLGWNAIPTSRNARGIDVLISSQDGKTTHTIQVKALSKLIPVPLGENLDQLIAQGHRLRSCRWANGSASC
jgi:hypothetical protein